MEEKISKMFCGNRRLFKKFACLNVPNIEMIFTRLDEFRTTV